MAATNALGLVDAGLTCLVEARRRDAEYPEETKLDGDAKRRLNVAITAAHTVVEEPAAPTDELRAMGLWWEDGPDVALSPDEAEAVFHYVNGDSHMIEKGALDKVMAKVAPEGF